MGNGWQGARRQAASEASGALHHCIGIFFIMRSLMGIGWQGARRRAASEASGALHHCIDIYSKSLGSIS